ncbi:MAG: PAS domain S-box protein [Caldilineaceae bacterium]
MRSRVLHPNLVLVLACLLAVLLFLVAAATPGAHFWSRYLVPIVVVFLWGRRRDIYLVTALASVLIAAGFWFDRPSDLGEMLSSYVLPLPILWIIAWLLAGRQQMQEMMAARTADLEESERRYRDLFDNSPDMYLSATSDHIMRECNLTLARTLGYSKEELIGRPTTLLVAPEDHAAIEASWPAYVAAGSLSNFEVQLQRKDGVRLDVLVSSRYNPGADGRPAYSRVMMRDITARLQEEVRVHETLARLQLATTAAEIGVWNWNLADGRLDWDERTCDLYAVSPDLRCTGLYYDTWQARVHPDDRAKADPAQGDPQRMPARWTGTYRIVLPGGAIRHVQSAAVTEYDRDGRPLRLIGVVRDVTDQVHYDQLLQETNAELEERVAQRTAELEAALAELQAASQIKDEFMAMISHELRTPLMGVLSLSELLQDRVVGPLNDRQGTYVRGIRASGERLLYVINSILGYTHLLSGNLELRREPCDLRYLFHVCATAQCAKAEAKQQVIEEVVEPEGLSVESDAEALGEVLKRLLDNAIKFTPAGGRVGLAAYGGRIPRAVQLVVWDTGPGFAAEQLEELVKPFVQGDGSLARSHDGMGMGLAYVHQMVRLLGGTLEVAPRPGGGSCFTIMLPG